jgi:hypothetical protein
MIRLVCEPNQTNEANFVSTTYYVLIIGLTVVNYHLLARGKVGQFHTKIAFHYAKYTRTSAKSVFTGAAGAEGG